MALDQHEIKESIETKLLAIKGEFLIGNSPERFRKALREALSTKVLCLCNMGVTSEDLIAFIIPFLNENPDILDLDLSNGTSRRDFNQIGDAGAIALARDTKLTRLRVSCNRIGAAGGTAIAHNPYVTTELDISRNDLGDEGAIALGVHSKASFLNVSYNNIGMAGGMAIARNPYLKTALNISWNKVGDDVAKALVEYSKVISLDISFAEISDEGGIALAGHPRLTRANVSDNHIGDPTAQAFALNPRITHLEARSNYIGNEGVLALANGASAENSALIWLRINKHVRGLNEASPGLLALAAVSAQRAPAFKKKNSVQAFAFLSGTHPRLGGDSSILTAFKQDKLFHKDLISEVFGFSEERVSAFKYWLR